MKSEFIKIARKNSDIKNYDEVCDIDSNLLEYEERNFYIGESTVKYPKYDIGDIVFVENKDVIK